LFIRRNFKCFALSALLLGLAMLGAACGDESDPNYPYFDDDGDVSGLPPTSEQPWNGPGKNPLLGYWSYGNISQDQWLDITSGSYFGSVTTAGAYVFSNDGTYNYLQYGSSNLPSVAFYSTEQGKYTADGLKITFYGIHESCKYLKGGGGARESYENRSKSGRTVYYQITNGSVLTLPYAAGSSADQNYWR